MLKVFILLCFAFTTLNKCGVGFEKLRRAHQLWLREIIVINICDLRITSYTM